MNQIQKQKEAYYKEQGIAPGVPTMKGAYGDPENTGVGYNAVLTELGNHDVPRGWIQNPRPNTTPNTNPGPPVSWNDPSNPDDPQAGYGYISNDTTKEETFFYHSDQLGSTSYITDDKANITQYDAYLPYGELLVDEHSSSEDLPYKFNGKQFDEETGLYYYGARYMNPVASIWYGVDPLAEKYTTTGGYVYTFDNPIKLIDPDGRGPGWNRFTGGLRVIGGSLQIIAGITGGIATSWSGVGAVVGGIAVAHGADDVQAGARQLWTGKEVDSFTFQGIKAGVKFAGASDNTANNIATFSDIGLGLVGGGAGLFKVLNKGTKVAEFTVAESKFDYFFGRVVEGNVHNVQRSAQNLKDLTALGISSKKQLAKIFATTLVKGTEVSRSTNKYGITINKVLNIRKRGQIQTSFFYAGGDLTKAPKVTTIIPKVFKKK